jgi:hypothetical protein
MCVCVRARASNSLLADDDCVYCMCVCVCVYTDILIYFCFALFCISQLVQISDTHGNSAISTLLQMQIYISVSTEGLKMTCNVVETCHHINVIM